MNDPNETDANKDVVRIYLIGCLQISFFTYLSPCSVHTLSSTKRIYEKQMHRKEGERERERERGRERERERESERARERASEREREGALASTDFRGHFNWHARPRPRPLLGCRAESWWTWRRHRGGTARRPSAALGQAP